MKHVLIVFSLALSAFMSASEPATAYSPGYVHALRVHAQHCAELRQEWQHLRDVLALQRRYNPGFPDVEDYVEYNLTQLELVQDYYGCPRT